MKENTLMTTGSCLAATAAAEVWQVAGSRQHRTPLMIDDDDGESDKTLLGRADYFVIGSERNVGNRNRPPFGGRTELELFADDWERRRLVRTSSRRLVCFDAVRRQKVGADVRPIRGEVLRTQRQHADGAAVSRLRHRVRLPVGRRRWIRTGPYGRTALDAAPHHHLYAGIGLTCEDLIFGMFFRSSWTISANENIQAFWEW